MSVKQPIYVYVDNRIPGKDFGLGIPEEDTEIEPVEGDTADETARVGEMAIDVRLSKTTEEVELELKGVKTTAVLVDPITVDAGMDEILPPDDVVDGIGTVEVVELETLVVLEGLKLVTAITLTVEITIVDDGLNPTTAELVLASVIVLTELLGRPKPY